MDLREEIDQHRPGQTQGPKCAIARYSSAYPAEAADLAALIADETWLATRLSERLASLRGWRIPHEAIRKHRKQTCGCYQRLRTDGAA